jgi:hypothetical protein
MSTSNAWIRAVSMHAHLASNGRITPLSLPMDIPPAVLPERNEHAVAIFDGGMTFERYYATEVRYNSGGPMYVTGSQQFVTGYLLAELALGGHRRRRARREAAPQWRLTRLLRVVVTNRRLWCQVAGSTRLRWMNFNYDTITGLTRLPRGPDVLLPQQRTVEADRRVGSLVRCGNRALPLRPGRASDRASAEQRGTDELSAGLTSGFLRSG